MTDAFDTVMMRRALFHAARGAGRTTPNPMVGAVVVSADGAVVGHGWHERAGEPHAEIHALAEAGAAARGGTLYVTLEPCCHHGRTGPCTPRIIEAGITRVVAAMRDPDARVDGRGLAALREHGVAVDLGLCDADARRLNEAYSTVRVRHRPLVIAKAAASLDARISAAPGRRTRISSVPANRRTHMLRAAIDGIAVGSGTMLADDPLLTARECYRARPLVRAVFDRRLRTPPAATVFSTLDQGPVIILTSSAAVASQGDRVNALERAGATVRVADELEAALAALVEWDVSTLLVEGGAELHAALWRGGLVDRLCLVIAPTTLGDAGVPLFGGYFVPPSELTLELVEPRGPDTWIEAHVHGHR